MYPGELERKRTYRTINHKKYIIKETSNKRGAVYSEKTTEESSGPDHPMKQQSLDELTVPFGGVAKSPSDFPRKSNRAFKGL